VSAIGPEKCVKVTETIACSTACGRESVANIRHEIAQNIVQFRHVSTYAFGVSFINVECWHNK
jgi:hypothetical protein